MVSRTSVPSPGRGADLGRAAVPLHPADDRPADAVPVVLHSGRVEARAPVPDEDAELVRLDLGVERDGLHLGVPGRVDQRLPGGRDQRARPARRARRRRPPRSRPRSRTCPRPRPRPAPARPRTARSASRSACRASCAGVRSWPRASRCTLVDVAGVALDQRQRVQHLVVHHRGQLGPLLLPDARLALRRAAG